MGPNSVKDVGEVTVLFVCTSFDGGLHLYKVLCSRRYVSYTANTIFIRKLSKGHNFVKSVGGMSVLILCASPDDGLYLYQLS